MNLPHQDFWRVSLREYNVIIRAIEARHQGEVQRQRHLQQELASLIAFAFHDPKNMPDYTASSTTQKSQKPKNEKLEAEKLRAALLGMHFASKGKPT